MRSAHAGTSAATLVGEGMLGKRRYPPLMTTSTLQLVLYSLLLALPVVYVTRFVFFSSSSTPASPPAAAQDKEPKSIMQPPKDDLAPPKSDPITLEELKAFDGSDTSKPIYVAIKGLY